MSWALRFRFLRTVSMRRLSPKNSSGIEFGETPLESDLRKGTDDGAAHVQSLGMGGGHDEGTRMSRVDIGHRAVFLQLGIEDGDELA
jgi:hypothetical protein